MTAEERKLLAKEIAAEMALNHNTCRLGINPDQAREIVGLANASIATKKIAGITAVGVIVTAFLTLFALGVIHKLKTMI